MMDDGRVGKYRGLVGWRQRHCIRPTAVEQENNV